MTLMADPPSRSSAPAVNPPRWFLGRGLDPLVAGAWIPFALAVHVARDRGSIDTVLGFAFLVSLVHQPVTLALVYGDESTRATRHRLFMWSPLVLGAAVVIGMQVSLVGVAVVAGLWNAVHTMLQRYGIVRIYGRRAGQAGATGERTLLLSWLALALVAAAADPATPARVESLDLGARNAAALGILTDLRPFARPLLLLGLLVTVLLTAGWIRGERRRVVDGEANPAKWLYVGSTAALLAWSAIDPIGAFIAYIGSHAVEYLLVVNGALPRRWAGGIGLVPRLVDARGGRVRFFAAYAAVLAVLFTALRAFDDGSTYRMAILTLGGLHILYDGFIWKLREPTVARVLAPAPGDRAWRESGQPVSAKPS